MVKRIDLIRHLERYGCELKREGGEHSIYWHPDTRKRSSVPRHREINEQTARKICHDLDVPDPKLGSSA